MRETAFKIGQYVPRAQIDKLVAEFDRCSEILNVSIVGDRTRVTYDQCAA